MPYTPLSTANTIQSWRLRINDIDSVKVETPNPTSSGFWNHTGRATIGNYGGTYQGVTLQNNNNSASAETISFIDTQNNLGTADSHIFFSHQTDGSSFISFGTTSAGSRSSDRRVDRMRVTGDGHLIPLVTNSYDLGTTSLRWRNIFTNDLHLSNGIGDYTIVEGEDELFLYNNKKGKVYKFALIEVDPSTAPPKASS